MIESSRGGSGPGLESDGPRSEPGQVASLVLDLGRVQVASLAWHRTGLKQKGGVKSRTGRQEQMGRLEA
jgi:hypothetical protein